jgi:hypothetical protein
MDFAYALNALKEGQKVERSGWNGKGMYLFLVAENEWSLAMGRPGDGKNLPWIGMKTVQGDLVPWLASQTDILADDWSIVGGV